MAVLHVFPSRLLARGRTAVAVMADETMAWTRDPSSESFDRDVT